MKVESITSGELAKRLSCELDGNPDLLLDGVATIEDAQPNQLTFLANPRYRKHLPYCRAGAIIIAAEESTPDVMTRIISSKPYNDFKHALEIIYPVKDTDIAEGINPQAFIHPNAKIGNAVRIGAFAEVSDGAVIGDGCIISNNAYVGRDVVLGEGCRIGFGSVLRSEVRLGDRVVIGDGTIIGFDGFGYAPDVAGYEKIPQVGTVEIADDVEIGANCCIDRASIGATRIGRGSKLDNLIQVAHGVQIGENTVIAAQTGISGSTVIGSRVMIGGQVGIVGHIHIGDYMMLGAQAGVTKSVDIKGIVSGYPARPHAEALRRDANVNRIPKLIKQIRKLEEKVEGLLKNKTE